MTDTTTTARPNTRSQWIAARVAELLAAGWKSQELATKRAGKEWRKISPQRAAANRRNAALQAARLQRLAEMGAK